MRFLDELTQPKAWGSLGEKDGVGPIRAIIYAYIDPIGGHRFAMDAIRQAIFSMRLLGE